MNRRQLESLGAAGAFDSLEPNRAKVLANADRLLKIIEDRERDIASQNLGFSFGESISDSQTVRAVEVDPWPRSDQMAKERECFGFYFAAHPVEEFRAIASANGARSHASVMATASENSGELRQNGVIAAMVENVQKRRTKRGKDFVQADFSDPSGQFSASCFEEGLVQPFQRWAAEGTCVLLTVELDRPSADEPPRMTVRGAVPLAEVTNTARMRLELDVSRVEAIQELAMLLAEGENRRGEVVANLRLARGDIQRVRLGWDFLLTGDLVEKLEGIEGLKVVSFDKQRTGGHLRRAA